MVSTRVGYAGGTTENPTYYKIGDHSESIQIVFDPEVVSYDELLEIFWRAHDPTARPYSRQYMSILFVHEEAQRRSAELSKAAEQRRRGAPIQTPIVAQWSFTPAEAYHQKYSLRADDLLLRELRRMYSGEEGFVGSTAAARVNGYLGGYGTLRDLDREIGSYGLSPEAAEHLRRRVGRFRP